MNPAAFGHVDETPAVIAEHVVDGPLVLGRIAVIVLAALVLAERGMVGVPADVMANIQVEVAVAVEVGEGGRGGVLPRSLQTRASGRILEGPVAPIAEQVYSDAGG